MFKNMGIDWGAALQRGLEAGAQAVNKMVAERHDRAHAMWSLPEDAPEALTPRLVDMATLKREDYKLGFDMHHPSSSCRIPPELWSMSEDDLDHFVNICGALHRKRKIPNNEARPNINHDDPCIGPNMYQVNSYVIQPLTLKAGGMSWALMRNPHGLMIDFFVTHGWSEGIFEFYYKLKRSWPVGKNGWICFCANPQAWLPADLGDVIGSADDMSDSPFVQALLAPPCLRMLVLPNVHESIYTRLWCVEEARRAISKGLDVELCHSDPYNTSMEPDRLQSQEERKIQQECDAVREKMTKEFRAKGWSSSDQVQQERTEKSRAQLQCGFTSVLAAKCSSIEDEQRIRKAMQGCEQEIDAMVMALIEKGWRV